MTTALTTTQQKAISLREELFSRRDQFKAAMPAWMTVDRLLRVVFTESLKNPRLLECTKESIFGAIMQAAQLGLEPILGRSYLIPYNNSKNVDGRWIKQLECQFQPGYQGLIDLARRSGTIADVNAKIVHENDDFDEPLGSVRKIIHKKWYVYPAKRADGPGEIFGAYAIWTLKDGTEHSEFMHISDIYKRREASQAYQYAINNPTNKKAQECPWIQWPEEQIIKTVIKHSSKLVPASIEFMEAVHIDNMAEIGAIPRITSPEAGGSYFLLPGDDSTGGDGGASTSIEAQDQFNQMISAQRIDQTRANEFAEYLARYYKTDLAELYDAAVKDADRFIQQFRVWEEKQYPKKNPLQSPPTIKDEIGNLKSQGLTEWEQKNHDDIRGMAPDDREFFYEKWKRVIGKDYTDEGQPGYRPPEILETDGKFGKESGGDDEPPLPGENEAPPFTGTGQQSKMFYEAPTPIAPWDRTKIYNEYEKALGRDTMMELIEKYNITDLHNDDINLVAPMFGECKVLIGRRN